MPSDCRRRCAGRRAAGGRRVVFTNGVFDLLHPGPRPLPAGRARRGRRADRRRQLRSIGAREQGPDAARSRRKRERAEILAALACVDAVVDLRRRRRRPTIIDAVQPDVLVKGADWAADRHRRPRHRRGARRARRADPGRARVVDVGDHREDPDVDVASRAYSITDVDRAHDFVARVSIAAQDRPPPRRASTGRARASDRPDAGGDRRFTRRPSRRTRRVFLVVPTDADVEQMTADARFFLAALQGLSDRDVAQQRPAVSVAGSRSVPRPGAAPRGRVRARAGAARAGDRHGAPRRRVGAGAAAAPERARRGSPRAGLTVAPGLEIAPQDLGERLALAGFAPEDPVDEHGEFCVRGGVVDFYPASETQPVRLEFIGDIVESVRRYDAATQRSLSALDRVAIRPQRELPDAGSIGADDPARVRSIRDGRRLRRDAPAPSLVVFEIDDVDERGRTLEEQWRASARPTCSARPRRPAVRGRSRSAGTTSRPWLATGHRVSRARDRRRRGRCARTSRAVPSRRVPRPDRRLGRGDPRRARARRRRRLRRGDARPRRAHDRAARRLRDPRPRRSATPTTSRRARRARHDRPALARLPPARRRSLLLFAETDLFEEERRVHERRRSATRTFLSDFRDLKIGDLVVHVDNGIGRFVGLKKLAVGAPGQQPQEFMELRYAGDDKLFVPLERLDLVQKYTGGASAGARQARRHDVGEGQDARQEGHARHGRRAAQALRRAQGRRRATRSARTRTGSRNSTTRSSTT